MLNTLYAVLAAQDNYGSTRLRNGQFKFTLTSAANTSAGVYNQDNQLIRTLWSSKRYDSGIHSEQWDGLLDDFKSEALPGDYKVKVLSNNVEYTWEGVIGSTSEDLFADRFRAFIFPTSLAFTADKGFYGEPFVEGGKTGHYFHLDNINRCYETLDGTSAFVNSITTDGTNIYYATADQYQRPYMTAIFAVKNNDLTPVTFANQVSHTSGRGQTNFDHFIDVHFTINSYSGIAVQPNGNLLIVGYGANDYIKVLDKTSGAEIKTFPIAKPRAMALGKDNELWIVHDSKPAKRFVTPIDIYASPASNGNTKDNVLDGNYYTVYTSTEDNAYVCLDLGYSYPIVNFSLATNGNNTAVLNNALIQGSNVSPVDGFTTIGSVDFECPDSKSLNIYDVVDTITPYRYIRIVANNLELSEFKVYTAEQSEFRIKKYLISNSNGDTQIIDTQIIISTEDVGISNIGGITITPDNSKLLVIDANTHQIKAFSNTDGTHIWTYGVDGGYKNNPLVTSDKFAFTSDSAIACQPDGSFWVTDRNTNRLIHTSIDLNYIEQIGFFGAVRSIGADVNDSRRVFCEGLEFERDLTKILDNGANGSWKLKYNWRFPFNNVVTLPNGITIGKDKVNENIYRLDPNIGLAHIYSAPYDTLIESDGTLFYREFSDLLRVYVRPIVSYEVDGTPIWANERTLLLTCSYPYHNSLPLTFKNTIRGSSLLDKKYVLFTPDSRDDLGYCLALYNIVTNTFDWKSARTTGYGYRGDFPRNGWLDFHNGGHSENCYAHIKNDDIFFNLNQELNGSLDNFQNVPEMNIWNHFHTSGLHVSTFGKAVSDLFIQGNSAGFAGNAFTTELVQVPTGYKIYHGDESSFQGVHSWDVRNLESILIETISVKIQQGESITENEFPDNLMNDLPYMDIFKGNSYWTIFPQAMSDINYADWNVRTNIYSTEKIDKDICLHQDGDNNTDNHYAVANFESVTNGIIDSNNWRFSFNLMSPNYLSSVMELLDSAGNILMEISAFYSWTINGRSYIPTIDYDMFLKQATKWHSLTIENTNGLISLTYGNFGAIAVTKPLELGGNWNNISQFKLKMAGSGPATRSAIGIKNATITIYSKTNVVAPDPIIVYSKAKYLDFTKATLVDTVLVDLTNEYNFRVNHDNLVPVKNIDNTWTFNGLGNYLTMAMDFGNGGGLNSGTYKVTIKGNNLDDFQLKDNNNNPPTSNLRKVDSETWSILWTNPGYTEYIFFVNFPIADRTFKSINIELINEY